MTELRWTGGNGGYLLVPQAPVEAGMQSARASRPMRPASCEEAKCEWFLYGHEGEDYNAEHGRVEPFTHPAGVECGDFKRCPHPNCPCPARKRTHKVPLESLPIRHKIVTAQTNRLVTPTEWIDRVREGYYTRERILTRGL
jgi:hypothetical protein